MVNILTLIIALVTLIVAILSYRYTREYNKKSRLSKLAYKKATLRSLQESIKQPFSQFNYDRTTSNFIRTKIELLQIEIKQLEKEV